MGSYSMCVILLYVVHMIGVPHNEKEMEKKDGSEETKYNLKENFKTYGSLSYAWSISMPVNEKLLKHMKM